MPTMSGVMLDCSPFSMMLVYIAYLRDVNSMTRENLAHALCRFIPEVMKQKGDGPYPGHTLYQLVKAIQKYLDITSLIGI